MHVPHEISYTFTIVWYFNDKLLIDAAMNEQPLYRPNRIIHKNVYCRFIIWSQFLILESAISILKLKPPFFIFFAGAFISSIWICSVATGTGGQISWSCPFSLIKMNSKLGFCTSTKGSLTSTVSSCLSVSSAFIAWKLKLIFLFLYLDSSTPWWCCSLTSF